MTTFPLRLVHAGDPIHTPAGWLIPSGDPAAWFEEILKWGVPPETVRLYVLPASRRDRTPTGALAVSEHPATVSRSRAIPYGLLAGRLYLPCDARLDPPVTELELQRSCPWSTAILHPGVGLIGFGDGDVLTVGDLLHAPPVRPGRWDRAEPGSRLNSHIEAVKPIAQPTIEIILDQQREGIGTDPARDLPPAPDEVDLTAGRRMGMWARGKLAGLMTHLIGLAPQGPVDSALIRKMKQWVSRHALNLEDTLQRARFQELLRLMHQLAQDPDRGLRHAIPLSGIAGRGLSRPTARLPDRDPNFRLADLQGGTANDPWSAPAEYVNRLRALYRELANRELALGRHRRAAFIFARLLGDYDSAASALRAGRHYREAAVLYRDFVHSPQLAAACLEEGGLLTEALEAYRELGLLEKVGELYERLDEPDLAARAYREAAGQRQEKGDLLGAAALLEDKLHAPEESLAVLQSGWPASRQAVPCLTGAFRLLGQLGHHEQSLKLIGSLADEPDAAFAAERLAHVLSSVAGTYPDRAVRDRAADSTRVLVGTLLPAAVRSEADNLLESLRRLAPDDRLLARDTRRFAEMTAPQRQPALALGRKRLAPMCIAEFELIVNLPWEAVRACGDLFLLAGASADGSRVTVVRGNWDGHQQVQHWDCGPGAEERILLTVYPYSNQPVLLALAGGAARPAGFTFSAIPGLPAPVRVLTPAWLDPTTPGLCYGESATVWSVRRQQDHLTLANHTSTGHVNLTRDIDLSPLGELADLPSAGTRVPMLARGDMVCLAVGSFLVILKGKGMTIRVMPDPVIAMEALVRVTRPHVAARTEHGVMVISNPGTPEEDLHEVGRYWENPVACFTTDALLAVADHNSGEVYDTIDAEPKHLRAFTWPRSRPTAILRAGRKSRFALITEDGIVRIYQVLRK